MQGPPGHSGPPSTGSLQLLDRGRDAVSSLPLASSQSTAALTLAEALAKAQQQQEDKRKRELAREKQKTHKSHAAGSHDKLHGAVPGADEDKSAYWMFVEVRAAPD